MFVPRKSVVWVGASRRDIQAMPAQIKRRFGVALDDAQQGETSQSAKPLHGFSGANVIEVVEDFDSDTYRAVYTVRFQEAIYVLHIFQKKSRQGSRTDMRDLNLIRSRLQQAKEMHLEYVEKQKG
jgi:phage-related protein